MLSCDIIYFDNENFPLNYSLNYATRKHKDYCLIMVKKILYNTKFEYNNPSVSNILYYLTD